MKHANGVVIDIFLHRLTDGMMVHEGQKCRWLNSPFTLRSTQFLGDTFMIPADPDLYLTENYGDWRKPAPVFETFVDTPNMRVTDPKRMGWYYYCKLLDYYGFGRLDLFGRVWEALDRLGLADGTVRGAVQSILAQPG